MQERHDSMEVKLNTNKNFFSDNYIVDIFFFITAINSLLPTTLTVYLLCKHKKLRMLIASLLLHQVKEVGTVTQKEITFDICKFSFDNIRPSNGCNFTLQKNKIIQRMNILQHSENYDIHFRCTILHTNKIMQNYR